MKRGKEGKCMNKSEERRVERAKTRRIKVNQLKGEKIQE